MQVRICEYQEKEVYVVKLSKSKIIFWKSSQIRITGLLKNVYKYT
jgi:hypothetical protein